MKRIISVLFALALLPFASNAQWKPAGNHIRTPWADQVSPENAHPEYPRPQMVRSSYVSLNGLWDYAITRSDAAEMPAPDGSILVPFPLESSLSGVAGTLTGSDALWYCREFRIPRAWRRKDVLLHFGAVDWACEVWLNGHYLGRHQGGYTAFEFNISPYLRKGPQKLVLKVLDGTDNGLQPRGKQVMDPTKGGIWYTAVSGIWQSVWMEAVYRRGYISDYQLEYDHASGTLKVTPEVLGEGTLTVDLMEGSTSYESGKLPGKLISSAVSENSAAVVFRFGSDKHLWSPDSPYLYGLRMSLRDSSGELLDAVEGYAALRSISVVKDAAGHKRMALNGKPLFQYGPLDQGWWPDGLYTAPTDGALMYDLQRTKEFGFNMIRKHVKVEPERWYYHCDRLGIMVWQDMPSVARCKKEQWAQGLDVYDAGDSDQLSPEARNNFRVEWAAIINQLRKFACIVVWVPFNEGWGQFETVETVNMTLSLDPTRLVNMSSGGNWISGGVGHIIDSHHYPNPKLRLTDPEMVNVLGEYGGIGLTVPGHTWVDVRNWGYVKMESVDAATATYEQYSRELIPIVKEGCSAAVYTQTTDVESELNGLMTYDRKVDKLIPERVAAANRSVIESMK